MVRFLQAVGPGFIALQSRFSNLTRIKIVEKDPVLGFSIVERSSGGCLISVPRGEAFVSKNGLCVLQKIPYIYAVRSSERIWVVSVV